MRYGFYLPTRGATASPDALGSLLTLAETLGFHSVVVADHVVFPVHVESRYPYTVDGSFPGEGDALEQLTLMAFVAARTTRLRIVSSVMVLPHRNPILTAKMLATIDVLSKGRLTVGIGVGWLREEFEALGVPHFDRRGALSDEYVRIFKTLWSGEPVGFEGEFYRFNPLHCLPAPVQQPHPPIWVGGHSPVALRRVARLADGWHPVGANPAAPLLPEQFRQLRDDLFRRVEAQGRDPAAITLSFKAPLYDVGAGHDTGAGLERRPFSGTPDQILDDIRTYERLGISELIFDFRKPTLAESEAAMRGVAQLVGCAST